MIAAQRPSFGVTFSRTSPTARSAAARPPAAPGPFDLVPEKAVAGAVVQPLGAVVAMADRRPVGRLCGQRDLDRFAEFIGIRRQRIDDRPDLRRVDAPHPGVAEQPVRSAGGILQRRGVLELGDDAVRRGLGMGMAGRGDLELGAHDQRVLELAPGAHRTERNRAAVRRDKVHQAERQRLDARMRGDLEHLTQRAMGLDQGMQWHRVAAQGIDRGRSALHVAGVLGFRQHQIGRCPGSTQHRTHHFQETRVLDRQQTHTDAAMPVQRPRQHLADQLRLFDFAADRRTVLVVEGDIEHRPALGLQRQRLLHARLGAGVVVADRQRGGGIPRAEQRRSRVQGASGRWRRLAVAHNRCLTPSCSPVNSARVLSMRSCEKASISRSGTMRYRPPSVVTG